MRSRRLIAVAGTMVLCGLGLGPAWATDVAANTTMSAIQANVTADGIINFTADATLNVDADGTGVATISVQDGINATIDFGANSTKIIFKDAAGAITLAGAGTLTVTGTNANAGFDFSSVASGKTLTITSSSADSLGDAVAANRIILGNTNTLSFAASGGAANALNELAVSASADAVLDATEDVTITTLSPSGSLDIQMAAAVTVTMTDAVSVPAGVELTLTGNDDGVQTETAVFTGGLALAGAAATLSVGGDDTDAVAITLPVVAISVTTDGAAINLDSSVTLGGAADEIDMTAGAGNLTLDVALSKTLTGTIDVNDNTLTLTGRGNPGTIQMDTAAGVLDVNATCAPTAVTVGANVTFDLASTAQLNINVNTSSHTLTLTGAGVVAQITASTGTVTADGTTTIETLTPSPGDGNTFTYDGTGDSAVTTITPMDTDNEIFVKADAGTLTVTNGFSFAGAAGIQLNVNDGTFVDEGSSTVTFGDDDEGLAVANGAVFTTARNYTGHSGSATNFSAAAGSTVNFVKDGTVTLTANEDDDFTLLGTTNILADCTVEMAGEFETQFDDLNVAAGAGFVNEVADSTLLFVPASVLSLEAADATLNIDGQAVGSRITVSTTTGAGTFTINRGVSTAMTFMNVALSHCTYDSDASGVAEAELTLTGVLDDGNNTNWFSALVANAGPDKSLQVGDSVTLEGSASGASGAYTFAWTPTTGLDNAAIAQPTASPSATTTYTLTVTDSVNTAKTTTDTVTVTVLPALAVSAGPDKTIVSGGSTMLDGSATGGVQPQTISWTPTTGLSNATSLTPTASPTTTTTYTLSVTAGSHTMTDTVTVTVAAALAVDAGADVEVPLGGSAVLQGSASGGIGPLTYAWSPTTGLSDSTSATPTASPSQTTAYTLTVTDTGNNNMTATDTVTVTVTGLAQCGAGLCGAGAVPLLPLTLLTMVGWSWRNQRRRGHGG